MKCEHYTIELLKMVKIELFAVLLTFVYTIADNYNYLNMTNYGPYIMQWKKFEMCSGPKSRNLTKVSVIFHNDGGEFNVTYLAPSPLELIKVTVTNIVNDQKIVLYSYKIGKPCEHIVVGAFLKSYATGGSKCLMKKGTMSVYLNFTQIFQKFLGANFFYGKFSLKIVSLATKGNIFCLLMDVDFIKR